MVENVPECEEVGGVIVICLYKGAQMGALYCVSYAFTNCSFFHIEFSCQRNICTMSVS
jgi:hypothetical protein